MSKEPLLIIGHLNDRMRSAVDAQFDPVEPEDFEAVLAADGASFSYALNMGHWPIGPAELDQLPNLKILASYGVGYDSIDAAYAASKGVVVTHTPDVLNEEVASTTIMLMLACYRNMLGDDAYLRAGRWAAEGNAPLTRTADGRKVGILGMGRIGQAIARKMEAFDAQISYHTRNKKDVPYQYVADLIEMARDVDVLVAITPGGAATKHLVSAEVIEALGPEGMLINVARGTVVDEAALVRALQEGKLGWAGLDVFEDEPNVPEALFDMSNVVLLPHVGSGTVETRAAMGDLVVRNLTSFLETRKAVTPVPECAPS